MQQKFVQSKLQFSEHNVYSDTLMPIKSSNWVKMQQIVAQA